MQTSEPASKRVLVIEDDLRAAQALKLLLEHYEYHVQHAATLADAVRLLDDNLGFVLLDLMLPDGEGVAILDQLRARKLAAKVIVITGSNDRTRLRNVAQFKPDAIRLKPVNFLDVLSLIRAQAA